jgi:hypothetical protein
MGECAEVLRTLKETEISVTHVYKDGTTPPLVRVVKVPTKGQKWEKVQDCPNADEVRAGTLALITAKYPLFLKPAYQSVLDEGNIHHIHSVAYTSNNIAVEFIWSDNKGYAGTAENQRMDRTPAMTVKLLRQKLLEKVTLGGVEQDPIPAKTWFDHVARNWEGWILTDSKDKGPLSGTIDNLIGIPSEESMIWNHWLRMAGDSEAPEVGDDMEMDGDIDIDVEDGDYEEGVANDDE